MAQFWFAIFTDTRLNLAFAASDLSYEIAESSYEVMEILLLEDVISISYFKPLLPKFSRSQS